MDVVEYLAHLRLEDAAYLYVSKAISSEGVILATWSMRQLASNVGINNWEFILRDGVQSAYRPTLSRFASGPMRPSPHFVVENGLK